VTLRAHLLVLFVMAVTAVFIFRLVRARQLRSKYALLWLIIGLLLLPLGVFPDVLDTISGWLGVHYSPTTFLLLGTGFLFLVVLQFSWELSRLESRTRMLAEEVALLRAQVEHAPPASADVPARPPPP
jgi:hypothetical protein